MSKNKNKNTKGNYKSIAKVFGVIISLIVIIASVCVIYQVTNTPSGLEDTMWKSVSAYDASNDEVDIDIVYDNYYSSYQGSMTFKKDGTFTFWMGPGNPEDGSHKGKYDYNHKNSSINAVFDNGEECEFKVIRNDNDSIKRIEVPYQDYTVYFVMK